MNLTNNKLNMTGHHRSNSLTLRALSVGLAALAGCVLAIYQSDVVHATNNSVTHYEQELARINNEYQANKKMASGKPDSWLHLEQVAKTLLKRAQLTGAFEDYETAQNVMSQIFALSGERAGPVLTRAALNFSIHRLPDVETDLAMAESALLLDTPTLTTIQGLRADVLFYSAEYAKAKEAYDQLELSFPSVTSATRLAHYHAHVGQFEVAQSWFETAEQRVTGQSAHLRSWLKLQLGILDLSRGRLNDALVHYQDGLKLFPGFWLLEEHVAEIDALQGRDRLAEEKYRELIERTGSPLFMSALADLLAAGPASADQLEAAALHEQINRLYETRIQKIPELMSGHALDYFLQSGDTSRALQLAQFNYRLRPGGAAALQLVQAHTLRGHLTEANTLLETLLKSPYRSAELHATASVLYRANANRQLAEAHEMLALDISPIVLEQMEWLRFPQL